MQKLISYRSNNSVPLFSLIFSFLFVCSQLLAQTPTKSKAVFEEKIFDFGVVIEGTKVSHDFKVKNVGDGDLVIQRIVPACGCTAASASPDPIKPGTESLIHVEFDTAGFSGEKLKTVRVYTNDFDNLSVVLSLKGTIESDITVNPQSLFFEDVVHGTSDLNQKKIVEVTARKGSSVKITGVRSFSKSLIINEIVSSEQKRTFEVSIDPQTTLGELRERIVIGISGGRESTINVPVFAAVKGQLLLSPLQLSFGILEGTKPYDRAVKLENRGIDTVSIKKISANNPAVTTSVKEIVPGKNYVIHVIVDPTKITKDLRDTIEITTDNVKEPTLLLNVYGILPPKDQ